MTNLPRPCLMLVTEPSPRLPQIAGEAVGGGVNVVHLRDERAAAHGLKVTFKGLGQSLRSGTIVVVNADWQRAVGFGARHIHSARVVRAPWESSATTLGRAPWSGSRPTPSKSAVRAAAQGADYILAGPIFTSAEPPGQSSRRAWTSCGTSARPSPSPFSPPAG